MIKTEKTVEWMNSSSSSNGEYQTAVGAILFLHFIQLFQY